MKIAKNRWFIYGLHSPENEVIRYIGKTQFPLSIRLNAHIYQATAKQGAKYKRNTPLTQWIRSLLARRLRPQITQLDTVTSEGQEQAILHFRQLHTKLLDNY